eukprot:TRINITY_DN15655_c0_g1_i1.p1 TRINITY_DN15655_c0_g1~~TRINITY_DN15655_c0_g1_i1.p1  ORF type:complete len:354 (-),score=49.15 TRINITY_DN15655_c0_g1_i1:64-1125(-)
MQGGGGVGGGPKQTAELIKKAVTTLISKTKQLPETTQSAANHLRTTFEQTRSKLPPKFAQISFDDLKLKIPQITIEELRNKSLIPAELAVPYINEYKARMDPTPLPDVPFAPRYPLVLTHGIGGDKPLLPYYYQIKADLESLGCTVFQPKVPRYATVYSRAEVLQSKIKEIVDLTGATKLNIVGHSMGGLDARHFIAHLEGYKVIASLTTVGTPHRGSPWAELLVGHLCDRMKMDKYIGRLIGLDTGAYMCVRPGFLEQTFNPMTPNHPDVTYFSFSGYVEEMPPVHPLFLAFRHISKVAGPNDGLVSVESAKWGNHVETLKLDHAEMINWCLTYDARRLYRRIANMLYEQGF